MRRATPGTGAGPSRRPHRGDHPCRLLPVARLRRRRVRARRRRGRVAPRAPGDDLRPRDGASARHGARRHARRLVIAHADDHAEPEDKLMATATTETVPLAAVRGVMLTHVVGAARHLHAGHARPRPHADPRVGGREPARHDPRPVRRPRLHGRPRLRGHHRLRRHLPADQLGAPTARTPSGARCPSPGRSPRASAAGRALTAP